MTAQITQNRENKSEMLLELERKVFERSVVRCIITLYLLIINFNNLFYSRRNWKQYTSPRIVFSHLGNQHGFHIAAAVGQHNSRLPNAREIATAFKLQTANLYTEATFQNPKNVPTFPHRIHF